MMIRWLIVAGMILSWLFGATASSYYIKELKAYLTAKPFDLKGVFYPYDFDGDGHIAYNEWVYESMVTGRTYRLLGTTPTPNNNFGFVPVAVHLGNREPQGYFVFIDFPKDQKRIFSWVYLSLKTGRVYKLMGATPQHRFDYLALNNMTFTIENAKAFIVYTSEGEFTDIIGAYDTPGFSWSVDVRDSFGYVADGLEGIQVLDLSDPINPTLYTHIPTPNALKVVSGGQGRELVIDEQEGLVVIDTRVMQKVLSIPISGASVVDVAYDATRNNVIVATDAKGVYIFHMAGSTFTPIDHIENICGAAVKVLVQGDKLYVADSAKGLLKYGLNALGTASFLGILDAPNIKDFIVEPQRIYIAYEDSTHIDIFNGFDGQKEGLENGEAVGKLILTPNKKKLYVLNKVAAITVYKLYMGMPQKEKEIYLPYPATDMKISLQGDKGYVTCGGDGLKVLKLK